LRIWLAYIIDTGVIEESQNAKTMRRLEVEGLDCYEKAIFTKNRHHDNAPATAAIGHRNTER